MNRYYTLSLCCLLLTAVACSDERTRQLNRTSKDIIDFTKQSKEHAAEGVRSLRELEAPSLPDIPSSEDVQQSTEALIERASTAAAAKAIAEMEQRVERKVDGATDAVSETKRSVSRRVEQGQSTVRRVVRKIPRSQREANQLAHAVGSDWMQEMQTWLDSLSKRGSFRVDKRSEERRGKKD